LADRGVSVKEGDGNGGEGKAFCIYDNTGEGKRRR